MWAFIDNIVVVASSSIYKYLSELLKLKKIEINRKVLADLAMNNQEKFSDLVKSL